MNGKYKPYDFFEGSPMSQGIFQFDMWNVDETKLSGIWDWNKLKEQLCTELKIAPQSDEAILKELEKPGLDPRKAAKVFEFDPNVKTIKDVRTGMILPGIVNNITAFGCFVDIGVKESGLVHISQLKAGFVSDVNEVVKLHQHVQVKVVEVDEDRKRIQLTMVL
jgi:uncharacterized protein